MNKKSEPNSRYYGIRLICCPVCKNQIVVTREIDVNVLMEVECKKCGTGFSTTITKQDKTIFTGLDKFLNDDTNRV
jgi:transcription elongation factor Elf1